jgi:hypothetical protein
MERLQIKKPIHVAMAQQWMKTMGYRWTKTPNGQFVDGHEWADIVVYRQTVFLPMLAELLARTRPNGHPDGDAEVLTNNPIVIWNHDESIFYANDQRKI